MTMAELPLIELGKPSTLPSRFRDLIDHTKPLGSDVEFVPTDFSPGTKAFFAIIFGPILLLGGGMSFHKCIEKYLQRQQSADVLAAPAVVSLLLIIGGVMLFRSWGRARKMDVLQKEGKLRLGDFFTHEALLQHRVGYVNLIPRDRLLRIEEHKFSIEAAPKFTIEVRLLYTAKDGSEHYQPFPAGHDRSNPTAVADRLSRWSGKEIERMYSWP